ncbi:MAG: lysophospholipid acyltransferase family protein, partial [Sedimenticola sp.]|nr:lysophospholipid acyltransferase family protein [Sedimenticola sp.]
VITDRFPDFFETRSRLLSRPLVRILRILFNEREINRFLAENRGIRGLDFIEKVLEYFGLDYSLAAKELENIPPTGRVVIVANHPLGALDALALILMVSRVRKDIRVVANDLLSSLEPLQELLLPVDNFGGNSTRSHIRKIHDSLQQERAVIVFPAGEVSRLRPNGVRDVGWKSGFLKFAKRTSSPILPVYIEARNSRLFYGVSMLSKPLSALLLVNEMFRQRKSTIGFRIGECIPPHVLAESAIRPRAQVKMLRRHLYRIGQGKAGIFATEKSIAHPESRQFLRRELREADLLGATSDGKQIILSDWKADSCFIREIGRLRELSFRKVGEGTGQRRDIDSYDQYYRHLVLWDDSELEIAGAYRFGETGRIVSEGGLGQLYSASLFHLEPEFSSFCSHGLELGRSFVQPAFWGSRALDYLWQGLGAYVRHHPDVRYLFGPVSLSARYPAPARDLIIYYFSHYYGSEERLAESRNPYRISQGSLQECRRVFCGNDLKADFSELKHQLSLFNLTVPTLFKQYTELCEEGGVRFLAFGVDSQFADCVDGLILVDLDRIKPLKRKRYIGE